MEDRFRSPSSWRLAWLVLVGPAAGAFVAAMLVHTVARALLPAWADAPATAMGGAIGLLGGGIAAAGAAPRRAASRRRAGDERRDRAFRAVALLGATAVVLLAIGAPTMILAAVPVRIAVITAAVIVGFRLAR
jgi:hypothetical protein